MSKLGPNDIRMLNLGPTAAWRTQAVYQATAELMTASSPDTIVFCQPVSPYLCLGQQQSYAALLDHAACQRRELVVVRRPLNGGLLYHDHNQLMFQGVFHRSRMPENFADVCSQMLAAPLATLHRLGLTAATQDGRQITIGGRRIASVSGGQIGEAWVVIGSLLFDFDYNVLPRVWRAPSPAFRELASDALREQITTIWRLMSRPITIDAAQMMLQTEFANALGRPVVRGKPKQPETHRSREILERLNAPESLGPSSEDGSVPPVNSLVIADGVVIYAAEAAVNGQPVRASLCVADGRIRAARLESDQPGSWAAAEAALQDTLFADWQQSLSNFLSGDTN